MNHSQKLRQDRLIYYEGEIRGIEAVLKELLKLSGAKCALLVDKEGHMVARTGDARTFDVDTISALVAGCFGATREMARLLGEEEFAIMFHQGQRDNIQLSLVGERTILTVIFDDQTTIGMIRLYASEATRKLVELFEKIDGTERPDNVGVADDYDTTGKARLDALFR